MSNFNEANDPASQLPEFMKQALEAEDTPDMVKRMIVEVERIRGKAKLAETDVNFLAMVEEIDYAIKNLEPGHPYQALVFEVMKEHLYGSPETAVRMVYERAAVLDRMREE